MAVRYLGHPISFDDLAVDPTKIQSVLTWSVPISPKRVHGFLGLVGCYHKFIRELGVIVVSLTRFLTKEGFHWIE